MHTEIEVLKKALAQQKRQMKRVNLLFTAIIILLFSILFSSYNESGEQKIIKARGLVIVDENGKERILIGAPVPAAKNRVRTDTARVRALWANKFKDAEQYMKWYKDYRHAANGIVIMDENGYDRLSLGSDLPDPNIGPRIGAHTGLLFNDEFGSERGGLGILHLENKQRRVVLGLDGENGMDAVGVSVLENGQTGFWASGGKGKSLFMGSSPSKGLIEEPFLGFLIRNKKVPLFNLNLALTDSLKTN